MLDKEYEIKGMWLDELVTELSKTNEGKYILQKTARNVMYKDAEKRAEESINEIINKLKDMPYLDSKEVLELFK